jgi:hypothetical protein
VGSKVITEFIERKHDTYSALIRTFIDAVEIDNGQANVDLETVDFVRKIIERVYMSERIYNRKLPLIPLPHITRDDLDLIRRLNDIICEEQLDQISPTIRETVTELLYRFDHQDVIPSMVLSSDPKATDKIKNSPGDTSFKRRMLSMGLFIGLERKDWRLVAENHRRIIQFGGGLSNYELDALNRSGNPELRALLEQREAVKA